MGGGDMYIAYKKNIREPPAWRFQNNLVHTRRRPHDVMKQTSYAKSVRVKSNEPKNAIWIL